MLLVKGNAKTYNNAKSFLAYVTRFWIYMDWYKNCITEFFFTSFYLMFFLEPVFHHIYWGFCSC